MTRLATQAKNRLHAVIQRHHLKPPEGNPFAKTKNGWWNALALGKLEKMNLQSDLETLQFAEQQEARIQKEMTGIAAENEEIGRLLHISGFGVITAVTVYAAIGDIRRFSEPKKLVGYAGLGARVHDSGMTTRTGKTLAPHCKCRCHRSGQTRPASCVGGSGACGGQQPSALEGGTGAPATAAGLQQSDHRHRAKVIDHCLACAGTQGRGSFRGIREGIGKDAALCLRSRKGKSTWATNGGAICA